MNTASYTEVKANLNYFLDECIIKGPVVITRNGKAVVVLVAPADDDDLERLLLSRSAQFQAVLEKSRKNIRAGKGLPSKQFWEAARTNR